MRGDLLWLQGGPYVWIEVGMKVEDGRNHVHSICRRMQCLGSQIYSLGEKGIKLF
jgi:hypothetical protein